MSIATFTRSAIPATLLAAAMAASTATAQIGADPGAYSRMGFGARGMGMGNAMIAVNTGDLVSYYNPALIPDAQGHQGSASFGLLTLDRSLNFLSYTQPLPPSAGISLGIIDAGVHNIDGRDVDGMQTGALRTSEDQVFLGFAIRFRWGLSLGVNVKLYYYHLYTDLTSTTSGVDLGALLPVNESLTLGLTVRDIGAKYKWDSSKLYGESGTATTDQFPLLTSLGAAWKLPDSLGVASAELEASNQKTLTARAGIEIPVVPELTLRAGIDRVDLKQSGNGIEPTFGFTVRKGLASWTPAVNYAYIVEPFASSGIHMISLSVMF